MYGNFAKTLFKKFKPSGVISYGTVELASCKLKLLIEMANKLAKVVG